MLGRNERYERESLSRGRKVKKRDETTTTNFFTFLLLSPTRTQPFLASRGLKEESGGLQRRMYVNEGKLGVSLGQLPPLASSSPVSLLFSTLLHRPTFLPAPKLKTPRCPINLLLCLCSQPPAQRRPRFN
jgi:hypothetical protein